MRLDDLTIKPKVIKDWNGLVDVFDFHGSTSRKEQWLFRGHDDSNWFLQTTFERAIEKFSDLKRPNSQRCCDKIDSDLLLEHYQKVLKKGLVSNERNQLTEKSQPGGPHSKTPTTPNLEDGLIRLFKRQCHHYLDEVPKDENTLEWLALMRHYGAPTRLLDWTYSFFLAVYFALLDSRGESAVWAINSTWIGERTEEILRDKTVNVWKAFYGDRNITKVKTFDKLFRNKEPIPLVYLVNPYRLNDRLIIQQGTFLCPSDICLPFADNLVKMWEKDQEGPDNNLIKYTIDPSEVEKKRILQNLYRMNINHSTLFPGFEGFTRTLETLLIFPEMLQPHEGFDRSCNC